MRRISENDKEESVLLTKRLTPAFRLCSTWWVVGTAAVIVCWRLIRKMLWPTAIGDGVNSLYSIVIVEGVECHGFFSFLSYKVMLIVVIASLVCLTFE